MKLLMMLALIAGINNFSYGYMSEPTTLYSDPHCLNAVTTLPATYFVIVLEKGETSFKVSYKDIAGYVKDVEVVDYEPVTKYASASFSVNNDGYPVKLRAEPSGASEVIIEVPASRQGYYYGDVSGSALIPQVGNRWHYVSYDDGGKIYYGYVYTSQVTVSEIKNNVIEKVEHDKGEVLTSPVFGTDFVLITCLCVPSVLIMYLAFKEKEHKPRYKE